MSDGETKVVEDLAKVKINDDNAVSDLNEMRSSIKEAPGDKAPEGPVRKLERNKSGPNGMRTGPSRRAPPKRSQSHKIGRPVFSKEMPSEPQRGVARNTSGRLRAAPGRTRSFGRSAPDRSGSTSSLKAYRKQQATGQYVETGDGDSVCDSVFTSASNQTLDSIMLRKKQFTGDGPAAAGVAAALRRPRGVEDRASFEFDESLHTVDSINLHHKHAQDEYDEDCDLSVFSESFASTDTYVMSDYEEEEGAIIKEEIETLDDHTE
mmetsp:Transcript_135209/g.201072  ORF Transcript_135209/g.201072 Transcript_135209/m.201072 type:complete len:264 (-) Transcript_135209:223-1014(-)|eukprot:CAMPEP_0117045284 /NCGR_PEP_ID=MMETSP0472-20121206/31328_1 /TAXON_ID=693140 ORGANISM="Tiarina fusus, Strain LIS" /NCGR_SAMPLE_ID=MMETSP0472 /ASSEMBLY_ACC=CAM_ASM_000603 /LENGTH=263 /DNA_ID=CAMNT_0004757227 /DNA_START=57 /DNA_END=848 /DNA_ORIENTATION=-